MRFRHRLIVLAAAGLLGGCGGDRPPENGAPSTTSMATAATAPSTSAPAAAALRLDLRGLGAVRVGMTVDVAGRALGRPLEPATPPIEDCTLYAPVSGFEGLAFLVAGGTVARVDVTGGTTTTTEGMAIGQTEAQAQQRYGNRLVTTAHDFQLGGHYLTLVPTDPADAGFRIVAETDGTRVTAMRAGRLPEVELTEGCA